MNKDFEELYFKLRGIALTQTIINLVKTLGKEKAAEIIKTTSSKKRVSWYRENKDKLELEGSTELERAFEIVLLKYIGCKPDEVPIVKKSEKRIVWRSYNPCPVLEACKRLGIDMREFCKRAYELPASKFFEIINPHIRFGRDYGKIRLYTEYCEEFIELIE